MDFALPGSADDHDPRVGSRPTGRPEDAIPAVDQMGDDTGCFIDRLDRADARRIDISLAERAQSFRGRPVETPDWQVDGDLAERQPLIGRVAGLA